MNRLLLTIVAFCVACGPEPEKADLLSVRDHPNHDPVTIRYLEPGESSDTALPCEGASRVWTDPLMGFFTPLVLPQEIYTAWADNRLKALCVWEDSGKIYAEIEKEENDE